MNADHQKQDGLATRTEQGHDASPCTQCCPNQTMVYPRKDCQLTLATQDHPTYRSRTE